LILVKPNFLDPHLMREIQFVLDVAISSDSPKWYTSLSWPKNVGIDSGAVCILPTPRFIEPIKDHLTKLNPDFAHHEIMVQLYVWLPGSYIPWHLDEGKAFGATIYLNEEWDRNWGGTFLYEDEGEIRGEIPEFNKLVLNYGDNTPHHVTSIHHSCAQKRRTVQIWGF